MRLAAIHIGRVTFLVELPDLAPFGKVYPPDLVAALASRCDFRKFPQNIGKEPIPQGLIFEFGKWDGQPITKLTIFNDGLVLETGSPTEDTEKALQELLSWAREGVGITFEPAMVKRKMFLSQLTAYFDVPLDSLHPILREVGAELSEFTSKEGNQEFAFRTAGITLTTNPLAAKFTPGLFSVERRLDVPDSENKYFSSAPVQTSKHLAILKKFEEALKR